MRRARTGPFGRAGFGALLVAAWIMGTPAQAEPITGYTFALSWAPTFCATVGIERRSPQCEMDADHTFVVHGLWPNIATGDDAFCRTDRPGPDRATVNAMLDIMPDRGLIQRQWRKHGTCSGLSAADYFALVRKAWEDTAIPAGLAGLEEPIDVRPEVLREAFLRANPELPEAAIFVRCADAQLVDVRICLDPSLEATGCPNVERRRCRTRLLDVPAPR